MRIWKIYTVALSLLFLSYVFWNETYAFELGKRVDSNRSLISWHGARTHLACVEGEKYEHRPVSPFKLTD